MLKKSLFFAVFLAFSFILCLSFTFAADEHAFYGIIIKTQQNQVVTNLGTSKGINSKDHFYVYRVRKYIGKIQITNLEEYNSLADIIYVTPGESIKTGDSLTKTPLSSQQEQTAANATAASQDKEEYTEIYTSKSSSKSGPPQLEKILKKYTKMVEFKGKAKQPKELTRPYGLNMPGYVTPPPASVSGYSSYGSLYNPYGFNVIDALQIAGWTSLFFQPSMQSVFNNNWPIYSSLGFSLYTRYQNVKNYEKMIGINQSVALEVSYFCPELVKARVDYVAYKEVINDESAKKAMVDKITADIGLSDSTVFQIAIKNTGSSSVQIAPINQHIYLIDPSGVRTKALKYDPVLDRALEPDQVITGFIYFPKYDFKAGQIKLSIEEVFGKSQVLTW